jgi:hypothetical protein
MKLVNRHGGKIVVGAEKLKAFDALPLRFDATQMFVEPVGEDRQILFDARPAVLFAFAHNQFRLDANSLHRFTNCSAW